eukprot:scaffold57643_cov33-Tisochrysis_lutea.AAC.1
METVFGHFAPHIYDRDLNESVFRRLRAQMVRTPDIHGRCAVVGSSTTLLKQPEGQRIDEAHTVIRVNSLPIMPEYFAQYTGNRTDVLFSTYDSYVHRNISNIPATTIFYCHIKKTGAGIQACWRRVSRDGAYRVSPGFVRFIKNSFRLYPWPSAGFMAFATAAVLCDTVHLYGFGQDQAFSNCSHYYNAYKGHATICSHQETQNRMRNSAAGIENYEDSLAQFQP